MSNDSRDTKSATFEYGDATRLETKSCSKDLSETMLVDTAPEMRLGSKKTAITPEERFRSSVGRG